MKNQFENFKAVEITNLDQVNGGASTVTVAVKNTNSIVTDCEEGLLIME